MSDVSKFLNRIKICKHTYFKKKLEKLAALGWILTTLVLLAGGWPIWFLLFYFFPILRPVLILYLGYIIGQMGAAENGLRSGYVDLPTLLAL